LNTTWSRDFAGNNSSFLTMGGVLEGEAFWRDLIRELLRQSAPLDTILAYELRNELFFETNLPPLSLTSGLVRTANGQTYDMASATDRQRMMDENLLLWIDRVRAAILDVDPTALVTVGFFPPDSPNPWASEPRFIRTRHAIWDSSLDFIDLHPYPGGYSLGQLLQNFAAGDFSQKPLIMGEFGAQRSAYAAVEDAARALVDWQVQSWGYGFDGWLLWTWDSDEQPEFYNVVSDGGLIGRVLAPAARPDPSQPLLLSAFEHNLARTGTARASRSLPANPPSSALNGSRGDWWGSGGPPPQWIEIDLGGPRTVSLIRLVVSQSPPGHTVHQVLAGPAANRLQLLRTFSGDTEDSKVLEFKPTPPLEGVRFVRVVTTQSPSWVSWREIELIGRE
jgi:hypothetical protein